MKYNGKEEVLFENDATLVDVCSKYLILKKDFEKENMPAHESNYQKAFAERYHIELTEEELLELIDFIESGEFNDWQASRIQDDFSEGMEKVK